MPETILTTGQDTLLHEEVEQRILSAKPEAIGIVSAFVSLDGVETFAGMSRRLRKLKCRLVAGTSHYITHPEALYYAESLGWVVRLGKVPPSPGIFHPKLIVGGEAFESDGAIRNPNVLYVGSANLTFRGLSKNSECGYVATGNECPSEASVAFQQFWNDATPADQKSLDDYAAAFADRNRRRKAADIRELGIGDRRFGKVPPELRAERPPARGVIRPLVAAASWAGLQSFTGGYAFQIEFPKAAGEVVRRLVGTRGLPNNRVSVFCPDEGATVEMTYRFYDDNSMFRLNVPNDTTGVAWARANHDGIALVEQGPVGGAPLRLTILQPGTDADEIMSRSYALGTWGRTTTRLYGWY